MVYSLIDILINVRKLTVGLLSQNQQKKCRIHNSSLVFCRSSRKISTGMVYMNKAETRLREIRKLIHEGINYVRECTDGQLICYMAYI